MCSYPVCNIAFYLTVCNIALYLTVSKKSLAFLQDVEDHSVIDISAVNPKLYEHIKEMDQLQARLQTAKLKHRMKN